MSTKVSQMLTKRYNIKPFTYQVIQASFPKIKHIDVENILRPNLNILLKLTNETEVEHIIRSTPEILDSHLSSWHDFLKAYQLSDRQIIRLIKYTPMLFTKSDVYHCGKMILQLKQQGYDDKDIINVMLPNNTMMFVPSIATVRSS
jgi:mTERF